MRYALARASLSILINPSAGARENLFSPQAKKKAQAFDKAQGSVLKTPFSSLGRIVAFPEKRRLAQLLFSGQPAHRASLVVMSASRQFHCSAGSCPAIAAGTLFRHLGISDVGRA